jgi:hypothetical protein
MPPPPLTYRTRRLLLQVAMIALFGGTLAVAAWVRHAKLSPPTVTLGEPIDLRWVTDLVTAKWLRLSQSVNALEVRDPYGATPGRLVEVTVERLLFAGMTPKKYLRDNFRVGDEGAQPVTVAGHPGIRVQVSDPRPNETPAVYLYACAVLPQRRAVVVRLQILGRRPNPWDVRLLAQIAEAVQAVDDAGAGGGEAAEKPPVAKPPPATVPAE